MDSICGYTIKSNQTVNYHGKDKNNVIHADKPSYCYDPVLPIDNVDVFITTHNNTKTIINIDENNDGKITKKDDTEIQINRSGNSFEIIGNKKQTKSLLFDGFFNTLNESLEEKDPKYALTKHKYFEQFMNGTTAPTPSNPPNNATPTPPTTPNPPNNTTPAPQPTTPNPPNNTTPSPSNNLKDGTVNTTKEWNDARKDRITADSVQSMQEVIAKDSDLLNAESNGELIYKVGRGDSLWDIAEALQVADPNGFGNNNIAKIVDALIEVNDGKDLIIAGKTQLNISNVQQNLM